MSGRCIFAALAVGLFLAGSAGAVAGDTPAVASTTHPLAHQVKQAHQKLHDQKSRTRKLHRQVDALQKHQQADRQRLGKRDATIARLHSQLRKLQQPASVGHQGQGR